MRAAVAATGSWTDPDGIRAPAGEVHAWRPGMNETGMNTAASVAVVASTAKTISLVPRTAAARGPAPIARWRAMFSTTTMASSTTMPMASTMPNSVSVLIE